MKCTIKVELVILKHQMLQKIIIPAKNSAKPCGPKFPDCQILSVQLYNASGASCHCDANEKALYQA